MNHAPTASGPDASNPAHPDDLAVDRFAEAMKVKLAASRAKGRGGWERRDLCTDERLAAMLHEHVGKPNQGNFVDVATFCMMLHQRGADPRVLTDVIEAREAL